MFKNVKIAHIHSIIHDYGDIIVNKLKIQYIMVLKNMDGML